MDLNVGHTAGFRQMLKKDQKMVVNYEIRKGLTDQTLIRLLQSGMPPLTVFRNKHVTMVFLRQLVATFVYLSKHKTCSFFKLANYLDIFF